MAGTLRDRLLWAAVLWVAAWRGVALAGDELGAFLAVHQKASVLGAEKKWAEAAKAYGAFAGERANDPCAPLAAALQGLILRRELNDADKAREAFLRAAKAPATPFGQAVAELARGWLARLQMEKLDAALRRYWVANVEYPEKLDALVAAKLATPEQLTDPWGKPFAYATAALKARPDLPRQTYSLRSTGIVGDSRSIRAYLKETVDFAKKFELKAIGGGDGQPLTALIAFAEDKARKALHRVEGEKVNGATLVKLTAGGAVLIEGGAIAVLAR